MRRSVLPALAVATLSLLPPAISRADMLCGGGRPPPDPTPSPSATGSSSADGGKVGQRFTTPCDNRAEGSTESPPLRSAEAGMLFGMVTLGLAAGVASRREQKKRG